MPGVNSVITLVLAGEIKGAAKLLAGLDENEGEGAELIAIPAEGVPMQRIMEVMDGLKANERAGEDGKAFAYSYTSETSMAEFSKVCVWHYERTSNIRHENIKTKHALATHAHQTPNQILPTNFPIFNASSHRCSAWHSRTMQTRRTVGALSRNN